MKKNITSAAKWIELMIHTAAAYFNTAPAAVYQPRTKKNSPPMLARKLILYYMVEECGISPTDAARAFGRSHSVAWTACRDCRRSHAMDHPVLLARLAAVPR